MVDAEKIIYDAVYYTINKLKIPRVIMCIYINITVQRELNTVAHKMAPIIVLLLATLAIHESSGVETSLSGTFVVGTSPLLPIELSDYPGIGAGLKNATVKAVEDFLRSMEGQMGFNMANSLKVIEQPITHEFQGLEFMLRQITENTQVGYLDKSIEFFTSTFLRIVNIVKLGQPQIRGASAKQQGAEVPSLRLDLEISVEDRYSKLPELVDANLKSVRNWMWNLMEVGISAIGEKLPALQQEYRKENLPYIVSYAQGAASGIEYYGLQIQNYTTPSVWNNYIVAQNLLKEIDVNNI